MERKVDVLRKFGKRLTQLRKERGFTYGRLARESGLEGNQIKRIEAGETNLLLTTIISLAKGLDVNPEELLDGL